MKPLPTVAVYGLVPVPPMPDTQACSDNDNQLLTTDNVKTSRDTGWSQRHARCSFPPAAVAG